MNRRHFDLLAQSIARGMSRREASRALAISGLSALGLTATPLAGQARRKTSGNRKKGTQDPNRLCARQPGQCEAFIVDRCLLPGDAICQELAACCSRLESCQLTEFIACMEEGGFVFPVLPLAALPAVAQPSVAKAGKRSGARKKAKKRCKRQAVQCDALFADRCAGNPDCLDTGRECCPLAGSCDVDGFLSCVFGSIVIG